jgi:hypothetical protein
MVVEGDNRHEGVLVGGLLVNTHVNFVKFKNVLSTAWLFESKRNLNRDTQ